MESPIQPAWHPSPGLKNHAGVPLTDDRLFFIAPPEAIGPVISASTSLLVQPKKKSLKDRLLGPVVGGIAIGFFVGIVLLALSAAPPISLGVGGVAAIAFGGWCYYDDGIFRAECSYLGEQGIAQYALKGSPTATPTAKVMQFEDAAQLRTQQTRVYKNGAYQRTNYRFSWQQRGQSEYVINGSYHNEKGLPEPWHVFHLGAAAEIIWTQRLLKFANQDLAEKGYVEFPVGKEVQSVKVGSNFLEFVTPAGESQRATVADMKQVQLNAGQFRFVHRDAKWWSGKGKYGFTYGSMPNARLFLMCLQQLAGIQFG
ncbi:MAG: hypothetical protein AAFU71_04995 [Cyanobacteria bacterium J06632_22]